MSKRHPRLLAGPYLPPVVQGGDEIEDVAAGEYVRVGGYSEAPIRWPRRLKTGRPSLIVTERLADAIRTESSEAIQHYWGVGPVTVAKWRRLLGVDRMTPGTKEVYREIMPDRLTPERAKKGREKAAEPESVKKMAATKKGRPASQRTREALLKAAERPKTEEHRRKIGEATRKAWREGRRKKRG